MVCKECQECIDFMGSAVYPYYGMPPHTHAGLAGLIGVTLIKPQDTWPKNFVPEDDDPRSPGVWYCPTEGCANARPAGV